jgi:pimeloyl-ACP methyl ester carboxylesterase
MLNRARKTLVATVATIVGTMALAACGDVNAPHTASPAFSASPTTEATNVAFGVYAVHIPANVHRVRGVLLALGGPDTRGFAAGTPFGAPPPVEPLLQDLGARLRVLAAERGLAIVGAGRFGPTAFPNSPASDQELLAAIAQAAALTGHDELLNAPIMLFGISGGGPEATGFLERNPARVSALFLRVPSAVTPLSGEALHVPAYMSLGALDVVVNNAMLRASFASLRSQGAPWALAVEPGVPHFAWTLAQRELLVDWMRAILPLANAGPFRQSSPKVGFLADPTTGEISPAHAFQGDLGASSWFPNHALAAQWASFIGM